MKALLQKIWCDRAIIEADASRFTGVAQSMQPVLGRSKQMYYFWWWRGKTRFNPSTITITKKINQ